MLPLKKISILILFLVFIINGFGQKKEIRALDINTSNNTKVKTFYTQQTKYHFSKKTTVYWTIKREIHTSQGDFSGNLLHGKYTEYYANNQLFTKGEIRFGVRVNQWKYWYSNGVLEKEVSYKKGNIHGKVILYDETGKTKRIENYKQGLKHGKFTKIINDTLNFTEKYKKGTIILSKKKTSKPILKIKGKEKEERKKKSKEEKEIPRKKWKIPSINLKKEKDEKRKG